MVSHKVVFVEYPLDGPPRLVGVYLQYLRNGVMQHLGSLRFVESQWMLEGLLPREIVGDDGAIPPDLPTLKNNIDKNLSNRFCHKAA